MNERVLVLEELVDCFDRKGHVGAGMVAAAEGEAILVQLLRHALAGYTGAAAESPSTLVGQWRVVDERVRVAENGKNALLDAVLTDGKRRNIGECKFRTANSLDARTKFLDRHASVREVWDAAFDAWTEDSSIWRDAKRSGMSYGQFVAGWPDIAKAFWMQVYGPDSAGDERILAIWRPVTSVPFVGGRDLPFLSSTYIDHTATQHLKSPGWIFSGSLYVRTLLDNGCKTLSIPGGKQNQVSGAALIIGKIFQ
ncbi:hypothetical protein [Blastococcus tunisiensis]|uniref:hypothetical protein n=1 Tax=Blastococcus tunisiensis TaxID=1798228 RepID=UPI0011141868|nr:hypothetical protein [Blastococcus sp. DSM 46838]